MTKQLILLLLLIMLSIGGCSSDPPQDEGVSITVTSFKSPCIVQEQRLCMNTKLSDDDGFCYLYGNIEGFTPQWGTTYEIKADIILLDEPPEDTLASSYHFQLVQITSAVEDEIGRTYDYTKVEIAENTITQVEGGYTFLSKPFTCAPDVDCETLAGPHNPRTTVDISFEYAGNGQIRLVSYNLQTNSEFIESKSFPFNTDTQYEPSPLPTNVIIADSASLENNRSETYTIESQEDLDAFNQSLASSDQITTFSIEDHAYFLIRAPGCPDFYHNSRHSLTENVLTISMDHYRSTDGTEIDCSTDTSEEYYVFMAAIP